MVKFSMNFAAELARLSADSTHSNPLVLALLEQVAQQESALKQRDVELKQRDVELKQRDAELKLRDIKIQKLTLELAHHRRMRFGIKSEALGAEQRDLFLETCEEDGAAIAAEIEQVQPAPKPREYKRTGRNALPPELERIEHRHEPKSCNCAACGKALTQIGEDVSEQLDVEPARFFVHRHIRPQYACRACETVTAAPVSPAIIDGGLASPGLYTWVVIQKYLDHLPLYRIEQISQRHGVHIARSTLAQWIGQIGVSLQPLVDRLIERLKQGSVLHADETPVQQLDPGAGKTLRAYMWAYRSNDLAEGPKILVFDYQPGRSGEHAHNFLRDWRGQLMVDDYGGYKKLFRDGVTELGCMAHARRKFFDLQSSGPHAVAEEALRRIAELYAVEAEARLCNIETRKAMRQQEALPRLQALHDWLTQQHAVAAPGSGLANAVKYSLRRWPALIRYAETGHLPIDNNAAENAIRPIALGRKNWLFTGSERAGKRAAAIQSLLATAKLNGLNPYAWLADTLEKLPTWPNSRIDELLPLAGWSASDSASL